MAEQSANQQTEEGGYVQTEEEVKKSPRMQMMEMMAERRSEDVSMEAEGTHAPTLAKPIGIPGGEGPPDRATVNGGTADQVSQQLQYTPPPQSRPAAPAAGGQPGTVRVKIDGVEQDVPLDDVIRNYQIGAAAQTRLEQASLLLREATERANQLAAQMQTGDTVNTPAPARSGQSNTTTAPQTREVVSQVLESLYSGDQEAATDRLTELLEGRALGAPSEQDILNRIVPLAVPALKQEYAKESALTQLHTDYPTLFSDPDLAHLANLHSGRLIGEGETEAEAILGAGLYVAQKFGLKASGRPGGASSTAAGVDTARRLEAKQGADPVPGMGATLASSKANDEPESSSATILEMRRARGQEAA